MKFYTQYDLNTLKLSEVTDFYNTVASQLGLKAVKKFRDKPTAIKRTLDAQELLREEQAEAPVAKPVKAPKATKKTTPAKAAKAAPVATGSRFDLTQTVEIVKGDPKDGSIEATIFTAVRDDLCSTVAELVDYIVSNHKRPRSGLGVDTNYAIHNIKWFARKGHIKLS